MPMLATQGSLCQCSFGTAPAAVSVMPMSQASATEMPVLTTAMIVPMTNIPPFAMCTSLANPQVAAATSAAMGVLTPQPCIPVIPAPWAPPAAHVTVSGVPAVSMDSKCACSWGGQISFTQTANTGLEGS